MNGKIFRLKYFGQSVRPCFRSSRINTRLTHCKPIILIKRRLKLQIIKCTPNVDDKRSINYIFKFLYDKLKILFKKCINIFLKYYVKFNCRSFHYLFFKSISRVLLSYVFNYLALLRASLIFLYFFEELFAPVYHIFS